MRRLQLRTKADWRQALVVRLLPQLSQIQFVCSIVCFRMPLQHDARLSRAVVKDELAICAFAALAGRHGLRFEARQGRRVRMRASFPREPHRRIARRCAHSSCNLVVLCVLASLAVKQRADDDRAVNIAFKKVDQHLGADARNGIAAPVGARDRGHRCCHPHPCTGGVVTRGPGMTLRCRMVKPAVALRPPCPVELHFDPVIAIGMDDAACGPHHDRALLAAHGRLRKAQRTVLVKLTAAVSHTAAYGVDTHAIQRTFAFFLAHRMQAAFLFGINQLSKRGLLQATTRLSLELRA